MHNGLVIKMHNNCGFVYLLCSCPVVDCLIVLMMIVQCLSKVCINENIIKTLSFFIFILCCIVCYLQESSNMFYYNVYSVYK